MLAVRIEMVLKKSVYVVIVEWFKVGIIQICVSYVVLMVDKQINVLLPKNYSILDTPYSN